MEPGGGVGEARLAAAAGVVGADVGVAGGSASVTFRADVSATLSSDAHSVAPPIVTSVPPERIQLFSRSTASFDTRA